MKNISIYIIIGFCFFIFLQTNKILFDTKEIYLQTENINAFNRILKNQLNIKDSEIENQKAQAKKNIANFEAFNGTDCARCHLEPKLFLPLNDNFLTLNQYINIVRTGSANMPRYDNKPNKTKNDITDSELRRQYKLLKPLFNDLNIGNPTEAKGVV